MAPGRHLSVVRGLRWPLVVAVVAGFLALPELFPGNSRLYEAIHAGDLDAVERLLAAGADPNSSSQGLVLARGYADAESCCEPPLMNAIWNNEPGIAVALVHAGADPNVRNGEGDTALIAAADQGMKDVVIVLLTAGADPRATNSYNGSTALHSGRLVQGPGGLPVPKPFADPELEALLRQVVPVEARR